MAGKYIVISGPLGSGKTTIINKLCERHKEWNKINETIIPAEKEYLSDAFKRQIWFYLNYKEKDENFIKYDKLNFADSCVMSGVLYVTAAFKTHKVSLADYDMLKRLFNSYSWKQPDLEIVIGASTEELIKRISMRQRNSKEALNENDIEFVDTVNKLFTDYAKNNEGLRNIIFLDTTKMAPDEVIAEVEKIISRNFPY